MHYIYHLWLRQNLNFSCVPIFMSHGGKILALCINKPKKRFIIRTNRISFKSYQHWVQGTNYWFGLGFKLLDPNENIENQTEDLEKIGGDFCLTFHPFPHLFPSNPFYWGGGGTPPLPPEYASILDPMTKFMKWALDSEEPRAINFPAGRSWQIWD